MTKGRTITSGGMAGGSAVGSRMVAPPGPPLQRSSPDDSTPPSDCRRKNFLDGNDMTHETLVGVMRVERALEACAGFLETFVRRLSARNRCLDYAEAELAVRGDGEIARARVCAPDGDRCSMSMEAESRKGHKTGCVGDGYVTTPADVRRFQTPTTRDRKDGQARDEESIGQGFRDDPGAGAATPGGAVGFPDGGDAPACAVAPVVREST